LRVNDGKGIGVEVGIWVAVGGVIALAVGTTELVGTVGAGGSLVGAVVGGGVQPVRTRLAMRMLERTMEKNNFFMELLFLAVYQ
jgi:hypothetical protein